MSIADPDFQTISAPPPPPRIVTAQDEAAAQATVNVAAGRLARAERNLKHRMIRYHAARMGLAPWLVALIGGSALGLVIALMLTILGGALTLSLLFLAISYVLVGAVAFWILRPDEFEAGGDVLNVRTVKYHEAQDEVRQATAQLASAKSAAQAVRQVLQSSENQRQAEINRLLAIDVGRLYPDEFERYVADVFRHLGYSVDVTGKSHDQGVDVVAVKGNVRLAIQAKRHLSAVGNTAVQEVFAGMAHYRCHRCVVVTSSDFTSAAISLAQSTGCVLIAKDQIPALVRGEMGF